MVVNNKKIRETLTES